MEDTEGARFRECEYRVSLNGVLRSYAYDRASNFMRSVMRRGYALSGIGTGGGLGFPCEWCMARWA